MKRLKLLVENFLIYGIGGAVSKIVPVIMLPIVTRLMSSYYYGLNEQSVLIVSFGSAIAGMGMTDAMFRLFFDSEELEYRQELCSSAFAFTLCSSVVVSAVLLLLRNGLSTAFFGSPAYVDVLAVSAMSVLIGSTNSIVCAPTRMNNQRLRYLVANTVSPIISYALAIPLLLQGWYVLALPVANLVAVAVIEVFYWACNHKWFSFKKVRIKYLKPLLLIGLPLMPNVLVYWVFNSADKLMITQVLGLDEVGIYSLGSKIGQLSNLIYTAFAGGWQYFAFSTMKDKDQVEMTSNVFEYLGLITLVASVCMTAVNNLIFGWIFTGDYLLGAPVAPYLFLAPLLLMVFQAAGSQFVVAKKAVYTLVVLGAGALVNVGLNWLLIPTVGIEGAAIATLVGYACTLALEIVILGKMKLLRVSSKFYVLAILAAGYFLLWRFMIQDIIWLSLLLAAVVSAVMVVIYMPKIKSDIQSLKSEKEA